MLRRDLLKLGPLFGANLVLISCGANVKRTVGDLEKLVGNLNGSGKDEVDYGSDEARQIFKQVASGEPITVGPTPRELEERWNAIKAGLSGRDALYPDDFLTLSTVVVPALRMLHRARGGETGLPERYEASRDPLPGSVRIRHADTGGRSGYYRLADYSYTELVAPSRNGITVMPGEKVTFEQRGYCLDPGKPTPKAGEQFALRQTEEVIPEELRPIFSGLLRESEHNEAVRDDLQDLIWALRTANSSEESRADRLGDKLGLLNEAYPGAMEDFLAYRQRYKNDVLGEVNRAFRSEVSDQLSRSFVNSASSDELLDTLKSMEPQGKMQPGSQYSMLAPGVAARTVGTDSLTIQSEIANTSEMPFEFDPVEWYAEPSRDTQSVAIPPVDEESVKRDLFAVEQRGLSSKGQNRIKNILQDVVDIYSGKEAVGILDLPIPKFEKIKDMTQKNVWTEIITDIGKGSLEKRGRGAGLALVAYELITGYDWLTGEKLHPGERIGVGISFAPVGAALQKISKKGKFEEVARWALQSANVKEMLDTKMQRNVVEAIESTGTFVENLYSDASRKTYADLKKSKMFRSINKIVSNEYNRIPSDVKDAMRLDLKVL